MHHMKCWMYIVDRVLDKSKKGPQESVAENVQEDRAELAADIEFFSLLKSLLQKGSVLSMASLETTYRTIQKENGVVTPSCTRKQLKDKITVLAELVNFGKAGRHDESENVFLKACKEDAISQALETSDNPSDDMDTVFRCAHLLRKNLLEASKEHWQFTRTFNDT